MRLKIEEIGHIFIIKCNGIDQMNDVKLIRKLFTNDYIKKIILPEMKNIDTIEKFENCLYLLLKIYDEIRYDMFHTYLGYIIFNNLKDEDLILYTIESDPMIGFGVYKKIDMDEFLNTIDRIALENYNTCHRK